MGIGIALGSGSARGWAHIGVLEALHEEGIHPQFVAGSSMGALVGAAYAAGNLAALKEAAMGIDMRKILYYFVQPSIPRSGLVDGERVAGFLQQNIVARQIEDLKLPFCAIGADMMSGEEVVFSSGDLMEAVRASISIPGIFTPVNLHGRIVVDGGIINPVPVEHARAMGAKRVIAVDVNSNHPPDSGCNSLSSSVKGGVAEAAHAKGKNKRPRLMGWALQMQRAIMQLTPSRFKFWTQWESADPLPNIFEVISSTVRIMQEQITAARLQIHPADVLIQPRVDRMGLLEFNRAEEGIEAGYDAVKRAAATGVLDCLRD